MTRTFPAVDPPPRRGHQHVMPLVVPGLVIERHASAAHAGLVEAELADPPIPISPNSEEEIMFRTFVIAGLLGAATATTIAATPAAGAPVVHVAYVAAPAPAADSASIDQILVRRPTPRLPDDPNPVDPGDDPNALPPGGVIGPEHGHEPRPIVE